MGKESLAVVQEVLDAHVRRDWGALYALYGPDVVFDFTRGERVPIDLAGELIHGHDDWRAAQRAFNAAWTVANYQNDGLFQAGDRVVHLLTQQLAGRTTGIEFTHTYAQIWTVRDGLVVRMDYYEDREQALRDAGLDPSLARAAG